MSGPSCINGSSSRLGGDRALDAAAGLVLVHVTPASATAPPPLAVAAASDMPAQPRAHLYSTATSIADDAVTPDGALVHKFDLSRYKDGRYTLVPASASDQIRYVGRVLHHGPAAKRRSKVNTVQFDWPAVAFEIAVRGTTTVAIRLKGDGSYTSRVR